MAWKQSGSKKVVSPSHSENTTACLAYSASGTKSSVLSTLLSSASGKLLTEASHPHPQLRVPPPYSCWYYYMCSVGQREPANLNLNKKIAHWGSSNWLMQRVLKLNYFMWSFIISYQFLMDLHILYFEGRWAACLCVFWGGRSCVWRSKFKSTKTFQMFL